MAARDDSPDSDRGAAPEDAPKAPDLAGLWQKFLKWTRRLLSAATLIYAITLGAILYAIEYHGESSPWLSFCLYLPPQGWLLPLLVLSPLALVFYTRLLVLHAGCVALVVFGFMGVRWPDWPSPVNPTVKILTNNIGQANKTGFREFAEVEKPDLIALQDATGRGPIYARDYPQFYVAGQDQFLLISKHRVRDAGVLPIKDLLGAPVAAWFEVELPGQNIIVFNVHMPTPRAQLEGMKGLGFLAVLFGRQGGHGSKMRGQNEEFWKKQVELARAMIEFSKQSKVPFIVAGDFNVPTHGQIYNLYAENWTEAFAERGRGIGATFPGTTRNPLTFFGPWLRLDNLFCGQGLRPIQAVAEPNRGSQHRSMVATFELTRMQTAAPPPSPPSPAPVTVPAR